MPANSIVCTHRGGDNDWSMYVCSASKLADGSLSWSGDSRYTQGETTPNAPAICWYQNVFFTSFRSGSDSYLLSQISPGPGGGSARIVGNTADAPALCVYRGVLYCVWQNNGSHDIYYSTCTGFNPDDGLPNWSQGQHVASNQMVGGASLVVYNDKLYCFHRGGDQYVFYCFFDGTNWSDDLELTSSTGEPDWRFMTCDTPAAISFDAGGSGTQQLFVVSRGQNGDNTIWTMRMVPAPAQWHSPGHLVAATQNEMPYQTGNTCDFSPSLIAINGTLYCVHPHGDGDPVLQWCRWRSDNLTWTQDTALPGNGSRSGVGLALRSPD